MRHGPGVAETGDVLFGIVATAANNRVHCNKITCQEWLLYMLELYTTVIKGLNHM